MDLMELPGDFRNELKSACVVCVCECVDHVITHEDQSLSPCPSKLKFICNYRPCVPLIKERLTHYTHNNMENTFLRLALHCIKALFLLTALFFFFFFFCPFSSFYPCEANRYSLWSGFLSVINALT